MAADPHSVGGGDSRESAGLLAVAEGGKSTKSASTDAASGLGRRALQAIVVFGAIAVLGTLILWRAGAGSGGSRLPLDVGALPSVASLSADAPSYFIMLDCGSSGTRLTIFKRTGGKIAAVKLKDKIKMGALSSYVGRRHAVVNDLRSVIDRSKQYVPEESQKSTSLSMYATAGMRVLPAQDQSAIFAACRSRLSDPTFSPYHFVDARTLSGEMEAAFQYLTVNYMKSGGEFPDETLGQIEMGGASLQVAFRPKNTVLDHSWVYDINGKRETIYATSYMGFGQNLARLKTQEAAVLAAQRQQPGKQLQEATYPCFLEGYSEKVKVFEGSPQEQTVLLTGSSDFEGCSKLTKEILHTEYECDLPPCAIHGDYMTKISGKFVAISGFKFALLNLKLDLATSTPGDLRRAVKEFCGQKLSDLHGNIKYTKYECFLGSYAYNVLRALGFSDDTTDVTFAGDYSWTLGATMYEALAPVVTGFGGSPPRRRLSELPGVQSVPPMDHECYWACRSRQRCAELPAVPGAECRSACGADCMAA
mmetsp:Transcript_19486/g.61293  ORF Transcript_19486/g.61293 Transcript_19486/m.61293 type:complete len:534 (+) Transcript_19486:49-1650(+)